jgi:hypothetical protein
VGAAVALLAAPAVAAPRVVLYDQYDNDSLSALASTTRPDDPTQSTEAADNFVVPSGTTWNVSEVDVRGGVNQPTSFTVSFYAYSAGLPGEEVAAELGRPVNGDFDYQISLDPAVTLVPGTYWVSVAGVVVGRNWVWEARGTPVVGNGFTTAWRNPGNFYGTGCTGWQRAETCLGRRWPDQMFRLVGTRGVAAAEVRLTSVGKRSKSRPSEKGRRCDRGFCG